MPLTDTACRNARCPAGRAHVRIADAGGLYLEVTSTGSKLWRWKYRYADKEKRLAFGTYPAVPLASRLDPSSPGGMLKGARQLRVEARALLLAGTDPGEARRDATRQILRSQDVAVIASTKAIDAVSAARSHK